jgi:hypothetical protein
LSTLVYSMYRISTRPHTHGAVSATFDEVAVLYPHTFYHRMRCLVIFVRTNTRAAIPVAAVGLVVYLDYRLASCRNDAAGIKHHAGDGVVVCVGVVDGASPEIPDLEQVSDGSVFYHCMTYSYTPVCAGSNEMDVVKLQRSNRPGVAYEAAVHLTASQIPEPHHAISGTTR